MTGIQTAFSYIAAGFLAGGFTAGVVVSLLNRQQKRKLIEELRSDCAHQIAGFKGKAEAEEARMEELRQQCGARESELSCVRQELNSEREAKIRALATLENAQRNFEEQKALIDVLKKEMTHTFNALSSAALRTSSEDFLRLASEQLGKVILATKGSLGQHETALNGMIQPLRETLLRYEEQTRRIEEDRHKAYGGLAEQIKALAGTQEHLKRETSNLVSALRRPEVRGRWGEMQLRRVAELSGMSMHCDFTEQPSRDTEKGRIRPDMVVHLPMGREIVVDAKVSLDAFLDSIYEETETGKKAKKEKHARQLRTHMNGLASKDYWSQFVKSPEFVVLFIPAESFLSPALEADSSLIEDGIQRRVIIATPTTFIALLRAVAYGWRQEQMAENAREVSELGRQLYERMHAFAAHFENVGAHIEKATLAYNKSVGSMESRIMPSLRRFRELGIGAQETKAPEKIDRSPRNIIHLRD